MSLAQSTARTVMLKLFLTSDHVTAATGKTVAITISKNGGAFGNPNAGASNATEVSSGWYKFALDTTDTNTLGDLVIRGTSASCDDTERVLEVVSATTGGATNLDAAVSAIKTKTDFLPSATAGAAGGLFIAGTNAATTVTTSFTTTFTGNLTGSVASVTGAVGSVTGAVGSVTGLTASDVGAIKTKTDFLPSATAGSAGGVFIAGTNAATVVTTSFTSTFTGNLTGNVGGNVTGSVGSVTGLTASNLDATISSRASQTSLDTVDDFIDTEVAAIKLKTDLIPGTTDGKTFAQLVTLWSAVLLGKASGLATTTAVYRAVDDSKDRVTATVDADGNRSAVTLDAS